MSDSTTPAPVQTPSPEGAVRDPPSGAPWDVPLAECPFALLDCEMTGLDPAADGLLEVALARVRGGVVEARFATMVRCGLPSCPEAQRLHGIPPELAAQAPPFEAVAGSIAELLDGAVPVAHAPELDVAFLDAAFERCARPTRVGPALDTLVLSRRAVFAHAYSLRAIAAELGFADRRWHRAEDDVSALIELFAHLCATLRPGTARDLWSVRVGQHAGVTVRDDIARALAALAASGRPATLVLRPRGRSELSLAAVVERWDPPYARVQPVSRSTPLRVLRADRVLRVEMLPREG